MISPTHELIVVAQKPFKGTFVDNILNWKVGAYNIGECRIEHNEPTKTTNRQARSDREVFNTKTSGFDSTKNTTASAAPEGRYPANTILSYDENDKDEVCGGFPDTKGGGKVKEKGNYGYCFGDKRDSKPMADGYDDSGSAARYFKNCQFSEKDLENETMKGKTNTMYEIYNEDSFKKLDELEENSIDAVVTDPPYGLTSVTERFGKDGSAPAKFGKDGAFSRLSKGFMGKEWDGTGIERNPEFWAKCLRVLKPGGYLLAFGGTRTYHRIATAIEEAGFDVKDMINWITGQGFPKGLDLGGAILKKVENELHKQGVENIEWK